MEELDRLREAIDALEETALDALVVSLNAYISRTIDSAVEDKETAAQYKQSLKVRQSSGEIYLSFNGVNKKITGLEEGYDSFSIKEAMLKGKGVKTSAEGNKYRVVPITKDLHGGKANTTNTAAESAVQNEIQEILATAKFKLRFAFTNKESGEHTKVERASGKDGLQRERTYESKEAAGKGGFPKKIGVTLFRTMSEKEDTSLWRHPGADGKNLMDKIEQWYDNNAEGIAAQVINELREMFNL